MRMIFLTRASAAALLVAACAAMPGRGPGPVLPDLRPGPPAGVGGEGGIGEHDATGAGGPYPAPGSAADDGGTGEIAISIRWPREVQAIPNSAATLDIAVATTSATYSASVGRPAATASITRVPEGDYLATAWVWRYESATDKRKATLAEATASVTVRPNRRAQLALPLALKYEPKLTSLAISASCPDYILTGNGDNFLRFTDVSRKVFLGGQPVADVDFTSGKTFVFTLPEGTPSTASVALEVDGINVATVSQGYLKVATIRLATDSVSVAKNQTTTFTAAAFEDEAGTATASATPSWTVVPGGTLNAPDDFDFGDKGTFTSLDKAGTVVVKAHAGCGSATMSVRVQ